MIICPFHGKFEQQAGNHLNGKGCKYCSQGNTSKIEQLWLDLEEVPNDAAHRNVRIKVGDRNFWVDGLFEIEKVIYEFLGDYWHGNPAVFNKDKINKTTKCTFGELFEETVEKIRYLRRYGYKVITIWENRFNNKNDYVNYCRKSW